MTDFDYMKFYDLTEEIEKYLGTLKANELLREYNDRVIAESKDVLFHNWDGPGSVYPCLFMGMALPYDPDRNDYETEERAELFKEMEANWKEAYGNGATWAQGIGAYLRDLCADVALPQASSIKSAATEFGNTAAALESVISVDWTGESGLDFNSWIGESSDACEKVVTNFQSKFRDEFAFYFTYAHVLFAGAGAIVVQTQKGLNKTVEGVRDVLKGQLGAWQESGGHPPRDVGLPAPWVADVGEIAKNVIGLIPVASDVMGKLENIAGIANGVMGLIDHEPSYLHPGFEAQTAEQIYTKTTSVLQTKFVTAMRDGLDTLRSDRANAVVAAQDGINPWFINTLEGIGDEDWEHEAEA